MSYPYSGKQSLTIDLGKTDRTLAKVFDVTHAAEGWEVTDVKTGRPVSGALDYTAATLETQRLNIAAEGGHRALATALAKTPKESIFYA